MSQTTHRILMIRPASFTMNAETAVNNFFQQALKEMSDSTLPQQAAREFDVLLESLLRCGVEVQVLNDTTSPPKPDSLFPNNWISFHSNAYALYPMFAENRRWERRPEDVLSLIQGESRKCLDFSKAEVKNEFLEGTGSLVLDRMHRMAYAVISPRTNESLVREWCRVMDYTPIVFHAFHNHDGNRSPIYHTNVMMSIGQDFALLCADCIDDNNERELVISSLAKTGRTLIYISEAQMEQFAGNMLEVKSTAGEPIIVMSSAAYDSLHAEQLEQLATFGKLVHADLTTIEKYGGGSARCMLAEIF